MISKQVFTATLGIRNFLTGEGVVINLLQVDRTTRALFAESYYGRGSEFEFDATGVDPCFVNTMLSWVDTLGASHVSLIDRIVVIHKDEGHSNMDKAELADWHEHNHFLLLMGPLIDPETIKKISYRYAVVVAKQEPKDGVNEVLASSSYIFGMNRVRKYLCRLRVREDTLDKKRAVSMAKRSPT